MDFDDIRYVCNQFLTDKVHVKYVIDIELSKEKVKNNKTIDAYIILTNPNEEEMGHFLLIARTHDILYFHDSFAMKPSVYESSISDFIKKHIAHKKIMLPKQIQHYSNISCGAHCVIGLYLIHKKLSIEKGIKIYLDKMTSNTRLNDKKVVNFIYRTFKLKKKCKVVFCDKNYTTQEDCNFICDL